MSMNNKDMNNKDMDNKDMNKQTELEQAKLEQAKLKRDVWGYFLDIIVYLYGKDRTLKALKNPNCQPRLEEIFAIHLRSYTSTYLKGKEKGNWREFDEYVSFSLDASYFKLTDYL